MAKKKIAEVAVEEPIVVAPPKKESKPKNTWEYKDRQYYLTGEETPIVYILKSKGFFWFDEQKGFEREIKYTLNR